MTERGFSTARSYPPALSLVPLIVPLMSPLMSPLMLPLVCAMVLTVGCQRSSQPGPTPPQGNADGPIIVGNGGGSSEFYLYYLQTKAPSLFSMCLSVQECALDTEQSLTCLIEKKPYQTKISLLRTPQMGSVRFRTAPSPGSATEINQDLLWKEQDGKTIALEIVDVLGLLIDAWGTQCELSQSASHALTSNLGRILATDLLRSMWTRSAGQNLSSVQFKSRPDLVLIEDRSLSEKAMSREIQLHTLLDCKETSQQEDKLTITRVGQLRWLQLITRNDAHFGSLGASIEYTCTSKKLGAQSFTAQLKLFIPVYSETDPAGAETIHPRIGPLSALLEKIAVQDQGTP